MPKVIKEGYCPECGEKVDYESRFGNRRDCSKCGSRICVKLKTVFVGWYIWDEAINTYGPLLPATPQTLKPPVDEQGGEVEVSSSLTDSGTVKWSVKGKTIIRAERNSEGSGMIGHIDTSDPGFWKCVNVLRPQPEQRTESKA